MLLEEMKAGQIAMIAQKHIVAMIMTPPCYDVSVDDDSRSSDPCDDQHHFLVRAWLRNSVHRNLVLFSLPFSYHLLELMWARNRSENPIKRYPAANKSIPQWPNKKPLGETMSAIIIPAKIPEKVTWKMPKTTRMIRFIWSPFNNGV
jgi:hypothetical protein